MPRPHKHANLLIDAIAESKDTSKAQLMMAVTLSRVAGLKSQSDVAISLLELGYAINHVGCSKVQAALSSFARDLSMRLKESYDPHRHHRALAYQLDSMAEVFGANPAYFHHLMTNAAAMALDQIDLTSHTTHMKFEAYLDFSQVLAIPTPEGRAYLDHRKVDTEDYGVSHSSFLGMFCRRNAGKLDGRLYEFEDDDLTTVRDWVRACMAGYLRASDATDRLF